MTSPDERLDVAQSLQRSGQRWRAARIYRQVLSEFPDHDTALHWLGVCALQAADHATALMYIQAAVEHAPDQPTYQNNLGTVYLSLGELDRADACFERALALRPGDALALRSRHAARARRQQLIEELTAYRSQHPKAAHDGDALLQLAQTAKADRRLDAAMVCLRRALQMAPHEAQIYNKIANTLRAQRRFDEAIECYRQALRITPGEPFVMHNMATVLGERGQIDEAMKEYERILAQKPDFTLAAFGRSDALLRSGDFERGWAAYESCWELTEVRTPNIPIPHWDGSSMPGKTILLHMEQGIGDTIQFIRYAPMVKQRAGRVVVVCHRPLSPLLRLARALDIDQVVPNRDSLPHFDASAPLLSLPRLMGTTLDSVPASVPYLSADPTLIETWRGRLRAMSGFRVGLNWHGGEQNSDNLHRFFKLSHCAPLAELPNVQFISLQKGPGEEQIQQHADSICVVQLGAELDVAAGAFMDTAAIMQNLDLVVSCDTSTAHLAGALGVPIWMPLPKPCDWRWMCDREDSPWYPTMRIFRQARPGDWDEVFERITDALQAVLDDSK